MERYIDAVERIKEIKDEEILSSKLRDYFKKNAEFIILLNDFIIEFKDEYILETEKIDILKKYNKELFEHMLPENYENSYLNPRFACKELGEYAKDLSAFSMEISSLIYDAYEKDYEAIAAALETFIQLYCVFRDDNPSEKTVRSIIYSYCYDYVEGFLRRDMAGMYITEASYMGELIENEKYENTDYLYRTGEYVSDDLLKTAEFIVGLPESDIDKMAYTWYKGFKDGFEIQDKPYDKKNLFEFLYEPGFERVLKRAGEYFKEDEMSFTVPRQSHKLLTRRPVGRGLYSSPNRQMDSDHSYDMALFMGERIVSRLMEAKEQIFEDYKEILRDYAGPVVLESFGERDFEPEDKDESLKLNEHQSSVYGKYRNASQLLTHKYINEEERSFVIIAWPLATVSDNFEEVFRETIAINTMDSDTYRPVQQKIIDALDEAQYVEVKGLGANTTDIRVKLHDLLDASKETNFENCLSDVNIPLGEVFTSPVLKGTEGILNVGEVYISGIKFKNLKIEFEAGRVKDYSCDNYEDKEAGKKLIKKMIFGEKENLPMGEFAIGTNTRAYKMGRKFDIQAKMPILIAEKTGPHFAVGDTCYSFMEDMRLYNPDGKEIVAKDNECSALRKENPENAYFAVHTDITIPYDELKSIDAVRADGTKIRIIEDGRFMLDGTEVLNVPLENR